jgi:ParD-like antitoxin of type II bacterial toxin-antitoxin system
MAQSIRISDDMYRRAQAACDSASRSLAQQLEYWARLGEALDRAGLTSEQAASVLQGQALSKRVAAQHERHAREVARGERDPRNSMVIPDRLVRRARVVFPVQDQKPGAGW